MLLAIDCGNTNTVFSIWDGTKFLATWRIATDHRRTADEYFVWLSSLMTLTSTKATITEAIISSTVPRVVFNLRVLCDRYFGCRPLVVGKPDCKLPVAPRVDQGTTVGPDRLVNTVAGFDRHGGDLIVVDFGTATTFDVVDHDGAYIGGVIAPGVNLSLEALHMAAAALPHVDVARPLKAIGTNTVACMKSGVYWGYIGLVEGIVREVRRERDRQMKVIATGGLASLFAQGTELFHSIEDDLTMHGLVLINDYNKGHAMNRLIYLPLGGAGEIGMNAYVYGYGPKGKERLILVDVGVAFPDMDTSPGVDLILPDVSWLHDKLDRLEAIFITHAHEDHIGALAPLWPGLEKKVYCRRFTATIGRLKFEEAGLPVDQIVVVEPRPATVEVGPFKVQFVPVSHSIPESSALVIDTPAGRIFHSADFKIDHTPVVGEGWDDARIAEIVKERPVKAMTCDSTNVFSTHEGRSEATLAEPLTELIRSRTGMVVATTFGSNVARLKTLAEAARAADRTICVLGRSMKRMLSAAEEAAVLSGFPKTVSPEEALEVPRRNLMLLVTGSQGERRAASAQLSRGKYLGIEMKEGDTFLFSSKTIPGNERDVLRVWNAFSEAGVQVIDDQGGKYHVSGHANRPDLEHVHRLILPDMLIPMHGEHRHLSEHARIATESGIAAAVAPNGTMLDLTGDVPEVAEYVETGRLYLDGTAIIGAMDGVVRDRIRMALNGLATVTVILDENDTPMGEPWVELMGLPPMGRGERPLSETMEADLDEVIGRLGRKVMADDGKLEEEIRKVVRQVAMEEIGKKPEVTVVISRLVAE